LSFPSAEERRRISERYYERDPARFLGAPSTFCAWAIPFLAGLAPPVHLLEVGCGPGRDARRLASAGCEVRAVDHSRIAIGRARGQPDNPPGLRFDVTDAREALRCAAPGSLDAVYAHAVYMFFSDEEVAEMAREVASALRPGGLHLFAVRSTSDPIAAQSREVAPDVFVRPPDAEPMRYYREATLERWTSAGFDRVRAEEPAGLHLWFVCDRRRVSGAGPGTTEGLF
jgi:SAM-dependent methyltransferase